MESSRQPSPSPESVDPLRIQAAAVVAQQAALTDEEWRLQQRHATLDQRERQLAAHFEARQHQLDDLHRQLGEARAQWRQEHAELLAEQEQHQAELDQREFLLSHCESELETEDQRLTLVRKRILKRWSAGRKSLQRQRTEIATAHAQLDSERRRFHAERQAWESERQDWEAEWTGRMRQLHLREAQCERERRAPREQFEQAQRECARLRIEAEGLENRIRHARELLRDQEQPATSEVKPVPVEVPATSASVAGPLERDQLVDQRAMLVEIVRRFAQVRDQWRLEQREILDELTGLAEHLSQTEADLAHRAAIIDEQEAEVEARLTLAQTALELEPDLQEELARLTDREEALAEMCRRWAQRRHEEVTHLRAAIQRSDAARTSWEQAQDEAEARAVELAAERVHLAEQAVALEQTRQELAGSAGTPAAIKRVERLQRHVEVARDALTRELNRQRDDIARERRELAADIARWHARVEIIARLGAGTLDRVSAQEREAYLMQFRAAAA